MDDPISIDQYFNDPITVNDLGDFDFDNPITVNNSLVFVCHIQIAQSQAMFPNKIGELTCGDLGLAGIRRDHKPVEFFGKVSGFVHGRGSAGP